MGISTIIQVAIGMLFVWIILAIITSQIQEWIGSAMKWRAEFLESSIVYMLGSAHIKDKLYEHPLIKGLWTNKGTRKPGAIPDDKFALVLFEQVLNSKASIGSTKSTFDKLKKNVAAIKATPDGSDLAHLKRFAATLDTLLIGVEEKKDDTEHAIAEARTRVESWFNNSMESLSEAYRRRMQIVAIIVALIIAVILNVDTVRIATALWKDPILREAVVTQANADTQTSAPAAQPAPPPSIDEIVQNMEKLNALALPVGWSPKNIPTNAIGWVSKVIGILLSGIAGAQGAPYWFDLMKKLINRNASAESTSK